MANSGHGASYSITLSARSISVFEMVRPSAFAVLKLIASSIVELGLQRKGRIRLGWINRAVNMAIRSTSDWAQYGYADFWASPLQTLGNGAGDCEDYAVVKYAALRELGVSPDDLRLVIVQDKKREIGHAVVAVRQENRWLILDNRTMAILDAENVRDYRPLFALDQYGTRAIATAGIERVTNR
jgi:predicted transglutaminase-like cysteine proteinase